MRLKIVLSLLLILFKYGYAADIFGLVRKFLTLGNDRIRREIPNRETLRTEYDFIIVGAGSAGCAMAARLSENPNWNVLLIEAGPNENLLMDIPMAVHYLQGYDINWGYKTEPSKTSCLGMNGNQCNWPRGKVMGGSSVLNYMVYTRGHPKDYDRWAELGNEGWDFKNVSYYFRKLENNVVPDTTPDWHGKNGPYTVSSVSFKSPAARAFIAAGIESGYPYVDYNGPSQVGYSFLQASIGDGIRQSTNVAYLYPITHRKNLHVRKKTLVTKILIDESKRVYGIQLYTNKKYYTINATREVILSAGAINTPQLLMLSGIGPTKQLKSLGIKPVVNLAVGYNLMDHTAPGALTFVANYSSPIQPISKIYDVDVFEEYFKHFDGPMASAGAIESLAFIETNETYNKNGYPDIEFMQLAGALDLDPVLKRNFGLRDDVYDAIYKDIIESGVSTFMVLPMIMRPKSRGRIKLRSTNPFDPPVILPNYFSDPHDIDVSVRGIRRLIELSKTQAMRKINAKFVSKPVPGCEKFEYDSDEYWECYTRHLTFTIYHYCGTAKMGPKSDKRAVVDPQLKVYGIRGLRVVDASIMPEIVTGHTNAPTIMIAEKAADLVKNEWNFRQ